MYRLVKDLRVTTAEKTTKATPPKNRPAWRRERAVASTGESGAETAGDRRGVRGVGGGRVGDVVRFAAGTGLAGGNVKIGGGRPAVVGVDEELPMVCDCA